MRTTKLSIEKNGVVGLQEQTTPVGYSGEHNVVELVLLISEEVAAYFGATEYFRFVINGWYSEPVYVKNNEIKYCLPQSCLTPPKINCQIIGYVISEGVPKEISKSAVFELEVGFSEGMQGQADSAPNAMEAALARCEQFEKNSADNSKSANEFADAAAASAAIAQELAVTSSQNAAKAEQVLSNMETAADSGRFDGFSPIANVTPTDGGVIIRVTDRSGTTEEIINHGISPGLQRCLRLLGSVKYKEQLPNDAKIGDVYWVSGKTNIVETSLEEVEINFFENKIKDLTMFDVYLKTNSVQATGYSQLLLFAPDSLEYSANIDFWNYEGVMERYIRFKITKSGQFLTEDEIVIEKGTDQEQKHTIITQHPFELERLAVLIMPDGCGLSEFKISIGEGLDRFVVYDGSTWLPLSSAGGSTEGIEEALDAIIAIQEILIGGATE